jgi:hypothetical protein
MTRSLLYSLIISAPATLAVGMSAGCNDYPTPPHPERKTTSTPIVDRFSEMESIHLELRAEDGELVCDGGETLARNIGKCFAGATREFKPLKWEVIGKLVVNADGQKHDWLILALSKNEAGLRLSVDEYWRGIDRQLLTRTAIDCTRTKTRSQGLRPKMNSRLLVPFDSRRNPVVASNR